MDVYKYYITVEAESEKEATNIVNNIKEIASYRFDGIKDDVRIRREARTKVMEEFAKTESGKMLDSFMKKRFQKKDYTPAEKIDKWTDIMHIDDMLEKENITCVKRKYASDDYYTLVFYNPVREEDYEWYLMENGMEAAIERSKTEY